MWPWGREDIEYAVPEGTFAIGENAFTWSNLQYVILPLSLYEIRTEAFRNSLLKKIVVPEGVHNIDKGFYYCDALEEIELPTTLDKLDQYTFRRSSTATVHRKVTCHAVSPVGKWPEDQVIEDTLYIPEESIDMYKVSPGWRAFGTIKAIPKQQYFTVTFEEPDEGLLIITNDDVEIESGTEVKENSTLTITALPHTGYELESLYVNGEAIENYSTITVTGPIHITASFNRIIKSYVVTYEEPANGSLVIKMDGVRVASGVNIKENSTLVINAFPDPNYELDGLWVNGTAVENNCIISVTEALHIVATFKPIVVEKTYVVTYEEPANGSLVITIDGVGIASGLNIKENSTLVINAFPDPNYELDGLWVNGTAVENNCIISVTEALHIVATFRPIVVEKTHVVTYDETENGILVVAIDGEEIESGALAKENSLLTVLAIPYTDYEIGSLAINGEAIANNSSRPVTGPTHISVVFVPVGTVGIVQAFSGNHKKIIYNLAGQRIANPTKGIYIQNGKKLLKK